jgi:hypothetical protein
METKGLAKDGRAKVIETARRNNSFGRRFDTCQRVLRDALHSSKRLRSDLTEFTNFLEAIDADMTEFRGIKLQRERKRAMFGDKSGQAGTRFANT